MASYSQADLDLLQAQTRAWLEAVLHEELPQQASLSSLLADGHILASLAEVLHIVHEDCLAGKPATSLRIPDQAAKKSRTPKGWRAYDHVARFLDVPCQSFTAILKSTKACTTVCREYKLTASDLLSASDVVQEKDIKKVCLCLRLLAKKAALKSTLVPDFEEAEKRSRYKTTGLVETVSRDYLQQAAHEASHNGQHSVAASSPGPQPRVPAASSDGTRNSNGRHMEASPASSDNAARSQRTNSGEKSPTSGMQKYRRSFLNENEMTEILPLDTSKTNYKVARIETAKDEPLHKQRSRGQQPSPEIEQRDGLGGHDAFNQKLNAYMSNFNETDQGVARTATSTSRKHGEDVKKVDGAGTGAAGSQGNSGAARSTGFDAMTEKQTPEDMLQKDDRARGRQGDAETSGKHSTEEMLPTGAEARGISRDEGPRQKHSSEKTFQAGKTQRSTENKGESQATLMSSPGLLRKCDDSESETSSRPLSAAAPEADGRADAGRSGKPLVLLMALGAAAIAGSTVIAMMRRRSGRYIVQKGDTLSSISRHHRGKSDWKALATLNPQLNNPDLIFPDEELCIMPSRPHVLAHRSREGACVPTTWRGHG